MSRPQAQRPFASVRQSRSYPTEGLGWARDEHAFPFAMAVITGSEPALDSLAVMPIMDSQ